MSTGLKESRIGKTALAGHALQSRRHVPRQHVPGDGCGSRGHPPMRADFDCSLKAALRALETACARHGVAPQAAARQYPLHRRLAAGIIPGARPVAEVEANLAYLHAPVPPQFRAELLHERLIDEAAPVGR